MDTLSDLATPLTMGILYGGLYVVIALGLSLVFGVMNVINVAHGDFVTLGGYVAFVAVTSLGLDPILWLIAGIPLFFIMGIVIQRFLLYRAFKMSIDAALIIAFGISLIIQNASQLVWTPLSRSLMTPYSFKSFQIGEVYIPLVYLLDFIAAVIVMLVVHQFLKRTYLGQAITAASQDRQTAELMGINPAVVYQYAFGIAMALAAIAGVFLGLTFPFNPTSGVRFLIIAFGVIILGGLGSMVGTFIGGMFFGLSQALGGYFWGPTGQLLVPFLMVLIVLTIRPQGLFGR
ncbi:MAG: branched-chain amino acid ABC transporter permease [Anaerolineales bacterium]|nr:MAG: branched-chain amino acid ABC transporter permease [Anaerolineales bacterium]